MVGDADLIATLALIVAIAAFVIVLLHIVWHGK